MGRTVGKSPESWEVMSNKDLRNHLVRLMASSAVSIVMGLVGREIAHHVRRTRAKKKVEKKLDLALEHSMDCSDPVAQY